MATEESEFDESITENNVYHFFLTKHDDMFVLLGTN